MRTCLIPCVVSSLTIAILRMVLHDYMEKYLLGIFYQIDPEIIDVQGLYQALWSRGLQARQPGPVVRACGAGSPTDHRPTQNALLVL